MKMTLAEFLDKILPLMLARATRRMDAELDIGTVVIYWVSDVLRIDIHPEKYNE